MDGAADAMVQEYYKLRVEVVQFRTSTFFMSTMKHFSLRKLALSLAKKSVNPIDKAQEHSMSIRANCLTWREYQMRLIQYQGMVHSRNDGTSFNVLGMGGCFTPIFVCTFSFIQIESNVLPIILKHSSDFLYLLFKEKARTHSFSIMFRSPSHLERTISYLSDRVSMYSPWVEICFSTYKKCRKTV